MATAGRPPTRPWRRDLLGVLAAVAMVLVAYHSVAFGGRTFDTSAAAPSANGDELPTGITQFVADNFRMDPDASAWQMLPWAQVAHREIADGRVPLWNPYQGAGTPLAANGQSSVFDPMMLAVDLHPTTLTWDLTFLFAFALGAVGMYLFLRNLGVSMLAALTGTAAFVLCGYFAVDSNNSFVRIYAYLPILFLFADRVARSTRFVWVAALAVAVAASILAGMPESSFFVVAAAAVYGVYRVITNPAGPKMPAAARLAVAGVAGLLLAGPLLVLLLGYLPISFNVHAVGRGLAAAPRATLLNWLVPFVNGYPAAPRVMTIGPSRSWIGAAGAALLVVAAAAPATMRRYGGWFFLGLGGVLLLKIHGVPGFQVIGRLPVANRVDFVAFAPPVVNLGFGVVIAIAIDAIRAGEVRLPWLFGGAALLAVAVLVLLIANRAVLAVPPHQSPARQYVLYALALAAAGGVLAAVLAPRLLPTLHRFAAPVAAGVMVLELLVLLAPATYSPRANPYRAPPWMHYVTLGLVADPQARVFGFDRKLYPNIAGVFGIEDVRSLDALYLQRYVAYVGAFVGPFVDRFTGDGMKPDQIKANPMFDLMGVRYVLTGPVSAEGLNGSAQYRPVGTAGGVSVFENADRIPRVFTVQDVHTVGGMAAAAAYLKGLGRAAGDGTTRVDRFDPSRQAVVESSVSLAFDPQPVAGSSRPAGISSYGPDELVVDVAPGPRSLLVLTDTYAPGWKATVNGRPAAVLPTDVAFRGVALGTEAARVVFRYRPAQPALLWGLPVVGLLGLLGACAATYRRRSEAQAGRA
jgi:hypothetical protein